MHEFHFDFDEVSQELTSSKTIKSFAELFHEVFG